MLFHYLPSRLLTDVQNNVECVGSRKSSWNANRMKRRREGFSQLIRHNACRLLRHRGWTSSFRLRLRTGSRGAPPMAFQPRRHLFPIRTITAGCRREASYLDIRKRRATVHGNKRAVDGDREVERTTRAGQISYRQIESHRSPSVSKSISIIVLSG